MASFLNLKAVLGLNSSGFNLGLKQAESAAKAFSNELKGQFASAFGTAAIAAYVAHVVEAVDRLTDLSDQFEISTKVLQQWGDAARKNGADLDKVAAFFERVADARKRAMSGDASAQSSFWNFGINPNRLSGMNVSQIGQEMGKALNGKNAQQLMPDLKELGGRGARELIPTLKALQDGLGAFNAAISDETLVQVKALKSELQEVAATFTGPIASGVSIVAKGLFNLRDIAKMAFGSVGAFYGALFGATGSMSDLPSIFKNAKAKAFDVMDEVLKEREQREKRLSEAAQSRTGYDQPIGPDLPMKNIPFDSAVKKVLELTAHDLTQNQRAGAFVRYNPDRYLSEIARNTALTAENTKLQAYNRINQGSGIYDAKEDWQ